MNHVDTIAPMGRQDGNEEAIAPFRIDVPDADRDDLRTRLALARWPDAPGASDWSRGVPADYLRNLADYWRDAFDWRMQEDRLNAWPQFTTVIDGQVIHFVHVRSREPDALPLILTHGWPSSFIELTNLIGPLVDPVAHGGDARDAFDVVIPSLPGFGYSNPVNGDGRGNIFAIAMMWDELMRRLGYERYAAQGGDIGAGVTSVLGVVATHVTGPVPFPFGPALEVESFSGRDRLRAERFNQWQRDGIGYLHLQATRPQTIGYSLVDSPTGLLAWIVEKVREWTDPAADLPEEAVDRDQLLATVSLYWFTRSGRRRRRSCTKACRRTGRSRSSRPMAMQASGMLIGWCRPTVSPSSPRTTAFAATSFRTVDRITGRSSIGVVTSRPWRRPTCWWTTSEPSRGPTAREAPHPRRSAIRKGSQPVA